MHNTISKPTRSELLEALRERYQQAPKSEKSKVLDEFVAVAGCHRKHAIRLLAAPHPAAPTTPAVARRTYDEAVRQARIVLWEAADRICGKRLKAVLPDLVTSLEQHGPLSLDPTVRQRLLEASAATIDRLLASVLSAAAGRKKRKRATKPSQQIPVRTFADWNEPMPGYLEIDFVAHGGSSMQGVFLWSLVATDVCSGWTEVVPLLAREQSLVTEGLEVIRRQFPVPVLGIDSDSDNDGAFINDTLLAYCQQQHFEFTRRARAPTRRTTRPGSSRRTARSCDGLSATSRRTAGVVAGQCLAGLFQAVRLFVNYFQPSFKLRSKTRVGAKVKKSYHPPATPCARLLAHASVTEAAKETLRSERDRLDPLKLLHRIREAQVALAALGSEERGGGPGRESLEQFLAKLPELWRQGEVRPTHRPGTAQGRTWRTREDPFAGVWSEILLWLQEDPEATAKALFERLERAYPGRFGEGQLRTLQRRIRQWRKVMARELVYTCLGQEGAGQGSVVIGSEGET
jgi:hypothetical protein